jgi:uncharacterized membrane protein
MIVMIFIMCYAPVLIIFSITPYITRKTESFGVSISEKIYFDPRVKMIRDSYRNNVLIAGGFIAVLALLLALFLPMPANIFALTAGVFVEIGLAFVFYLGGHKKMKALKAENNWMGNNKHQVIVVDTEFRQKRVRVSKGWFLLYIIVILATLGIGFAMYDKMPDRVPIHYNINGEADLWVDKSYKVLFAIPGVQSFIMFLMMFVYWTIGKAKQQVDASDPERSIEQNRLFRYRWSAFTVFAGLAMVAMFSLFQLSSIGLVNDTRLLTILPLLISSSIVAVSIVLSITTGQGGSRISVRQGEFKDVINRDDDKYWKLGVFYYNPDDPALFVEKRFGIGWTNNFARPMSWIMIIGFIVILILIYVVSMMSAK